MTLSPALLDTLDRRGRWTVRRAAARALRPDPDLLVSEWAARHRIIASEEGAESGRWSNARAPYLTEIMDCLSPAHPAERVTVQKCAQTGFSQVATNFLFYVADQAPGPSMLIQATVDAGKAWVRQKLNPAVDVTPRIRARFDRQTSRDEQGSTTLFKKFAGGFLLIAGANSAAALRQHTIRFMVKDDWDQWPQDIDGQGDPDGMAEARLTVYRHHGTAKVLQGSTPTIEGLSRSFAAYQASDQRVYEMPCPDCGHAQELVWENLKFAKQAPFEARYQCADCGVLIEHHHKTAMLAQGAWRATNAGPGRQPGFRIYGVMSAFKSWDDLAADHAACGNDQQKLKVFYNTSVGRPWREEGTAPPWHELMKRAGDWKLRVVPPGALVITAGVDVQKAELRYQVVGWGPGKTSWSIDYGAILGDTADIGANGPWMELDRLLARRYPDAFGRTRGIDLMAIDAGYNTQAVYDFVRRRHNAMAVKGREGANALVIAPAKKEETTQGGKLKLRGVVLYLVGQWRLKSEFFGQLRQKPPERDGQTIHDAPYPLGYCHFSREHDEAFFKELTAEQLAVRSRAGKTRMEWVETGPNHYLDTRIYAMAAAERKGLGRMTIGDWQTLSDRLEVPASATEDDLFALARSRVRAGPTVAVEPSVDETSTATLAEPPRPLPPGEGGVRDIDALNLPAAERRRGPRKSFTARPKEKW